MAKYSNGLQPIIDDLSAQCTKWMNGGAKPGGIYSSSDFYAAEDLCYVTSSGYPFAGRTFWTGAGIYPFEESELASFCKRNNLTYHLSSRTTNSFFVRIYASSADILKKSELLDQWRDQKKAEANHAVRLTRLIPLADKFYLSDIVRQTMIGCSYKNTYAGHKTPPTEYTYASFLHHYSRITFAGKGYRNLANDDELIAFVIACSARYYEIMPSSMDLSRLDHPQVETVCGQRMIRYTPVYKLPDSAPLPKKDFF
jgi:hypothetical protein